MREGGETEIEGNRERRRGREKRMIERGDGETGKMGRRGGTERERERESERERERERERENFRTKDRRSRKCL